MRQGRSQAMGIAPKWESSPQCLVRANHRRVAPGAFANKRFSPNHCMANRHAAVERFGVQFDLNRIGIQFVYVDLHLETMLLSLGLHMHGAEPQLGPMIRELAAPAQQTLSRCRSIQASTAI